MIYTAQFSSPVGTITAASSGQALVGLWLEGQRHFAAGFTGTPMESPNDPVLQAAGAWLERYFQGGQPDPSAIPLAPEGTAFQQTVWAVLRQIPYGQSTTYGAIAGKLGKGSGAARAIGGAVGRNPISILIPCHRVLGLDGSLTGYAGGLEKKIALLTLEKIPYKSPARQFSDK